MMKLTTMLVLAWFNTPMYFRSREEAMRSFGDACRDPKNGTFANHASDYSMWLVGYIGMTLEW